MAIALFKQLNVNTEIRFIEATKNAEILRQLMETDSIAGTARFNQSNVNSEVHL